MDHLKQLQKAVAGSAEHQARLQAVKSEQEAISALLEIAGSENIALERADLEKQVEAAKEKTGELSDDELEAASGGLFGAILLSVVGVGVACGVVSIKADAMKVGCGRELRGIPLI